MCVGCVCVWSCEESRSPVCVWGVCVCGAVRRAGVLCVCGVCVCVWSCEESRSPVCVWALQFVIQYGAVEFLST